MEAAAIGLVAEVERVPWMIVAKGVQDFADHDKDDSLESLRVFERVAPHRDEIGFVARLNRADSIGKAE